jgi:hypothetical protein
VQAVVRAATSSVETITSKTTRSVEPLAAVAVDTATHALETATTVLPSGTQALLGPLVETVDGQAEKLAGSLIRPGAAALGDPVRTVTGVLAPVQTPGLPSAWDSGGPTAAPSLAPTASATPGRGAARNGPARLLSPGDGSSAGAWSRSTAPPAWPIARSPATTPNGVGAVRPGSPPAAPRSGAPAAPPFSPGSSAGFSAAFAVLAGLLALALAALLGRLLPWSDTIRPLALVSPPERPG